MFYVYLIRSIYHPREKYVGFTTDVLARLAKHNEGGSPHTSGFRPWKLNAYVAFESEAAARSFEKYLEWFSKVMSR